MRRRAAYCALCVVAATTATAIADPAPRARLTYAREGNAAATCPDEAALRALVASRLGYDPFAADATRALAVRIEPGERGRGLRAKIELTDDSGRTATRTLATARADCRDLAPTLGLALALAIDPLGDTRSTPAKNQTNTANHNNDIKEDKINKTPKTPPSRPYTPIPDTPETPPLGVPRPEEPAPDRTLHVRLGVGFLSSMGTTPDVPSSFGFTLDAGLLRGRFSLDLEARADLPASQPVASGASGSGLFTYWLAAGALVPCVHIDVLAGCALALVGAQMGGGSGLARSQTYVDPLLAFGVRVAVEVPFFRVMALRIYGDLLFSVTQVEYQIDGRDALRSFVVSGVIGLAGLARVR